MAVYTTLTPDNHKETDVPSSATRPPTISDAESSSFIQERDEDGGARGEGQDGIVYLQGPRFWLVYTSVSIMMFLSNFQVPIVTTALVAICQDLGGFDISSWVIAGYLLGYVAVIVICAKFSDIFGRKPVFVLSIVLFILSSAACSAAQTLVQLIVFRAFQGVACGCSFSLCTILTVELVSPSKYSQFVSHIAVINAVAQLLGPIIGGAIVSSASWRWIFIINVLIAIPALIISIFLIPKGFPYHGHSEYSTKNPAPPLPKKALSRIDILGSVLILSGTVALTTGFEEAGKTFPWRSAYVITLLTLAGVFWITLIIWERRVTLADQIREPVLPWRFFKNREMIGILLNFIFLGGPSTIAALIIPQWYQLVYGISGLLAGVQLLPYTLAVPIGAFAASSLARKLRTPPIYLLVTGSLLQVAGFALLATLPFSFYVPPRMYGGEFVAGIGCGINFSLLFVMIPFVNDSRDQAVAMGAGAQFRSMGSSIALAVASSVFSSATRAMLKEVFRDSNPQQLVFSDTLLSSLPDATRESAQRVLAEGYNWQFLVLLISAALQIPACLLMWRRKQLRV